MNKTYAEILFEDQKRCAEFVNPIDIDTEVKIFLKLQKAGKNPIPNKRVYEEVYNEQPEDFADESDEEREE